MRRSLPDHLVAQDGSYWRPCSRCGASMMTPPITFE